LIARLAAGPLLADGGMGTELYQRGLPVGACFEAANLEQPELVQAIHLDYLAAGADLIETNSFGANRPRLEAVGLGEQLRAINRAAGRLARYARDIGGSTALIAGAIGPLDQPLAPLGPISEEAARDAFTEQAEALLESGVDCFIIETFGDLNELCLAVLAVQALTDLPIIAEATFDEDGRTPRGQTPLKVAGALVDLGVAVVGANCSTGPQGVLRAACQMLRQASTPRPITAAAAIPTGDTAGRCRIYVSAMPNAGMPTRSAGRLLYLTSPDYFARMMPEALAAGVRLLGGCCGTRPAHIAAMRAALDEALTAGAAGVACLPAEPSSPAVPRPHIAVEDVREGQTPEPTAWARKLSEKKFAVSVELSPPRGFRTGALLRHARELAQSGLVDACNLTDSPMARVRMDALSACTLIQAHTGLPTILHMTTRDRNLMGLEAALIGAHAVGVRNILALTGDPPSLGQFGHATGVYDVDSVGLVRIIRSMQHGQDLAGTEMGHPGGFCVGVAVDPTKPDLSDEARRLKLKLEAGAEFVMTQPIFDLALWRRFLEVLSAVSCREAETGYGRIGVPVILGVLPLLSERHAEFLHHEVPGITLTDAVRDRIRRAGAESRAEGVRLAKDIIAEARDLFQGVYLMPSYNRVEVALEVLS
jgi:homocysteine S-methyltransferase